MTDDAGRPRRFQPKRRRRLESTNGSSPAIQLAILHELLITCDEAANLTRRGREAFDDDFVIRYAANQIVLHCAEGLSRLSDATLLLAPDIPTALVRGMRNRIARCSASVDYEIVWHVIAVEIPSLRDKFNALADGLEA